MRFSDVEIKFRTFDELLASVQGDFSAYNLEGQIDPMDYIKIAKRINKELLIDTAHELDKEVILCVEHGRVRLPNNFRMLNLVLLCGDYEVTRPVPSGIQTEDKILNADELAVADPATVRFTENCDAYQVVQTFKFETRTYRYFGRVDMQAGPHVRQVSLPGQIHTPYKATGYIKDGWLYLNVDEATVYLSYTADLEDDAGNLLVLDHDMVNEYYEYAMKERILENLYIGGEDVANKLSLITQKLRNARITARTLTGMPEFTELKALRAANRKVMYKRFYNMFLR